MQRNRVEHRGGELATSGRIDHDRCARDLLALAQANLTWIGQSPDAIVRGLGDLFATLVHANLIEVRFADEGMRMAIPDDPAAARAQSRWRRLARVEIGERGELGQVVLGANRSDFPDALELAVIRAAASHAAGAVQHARAASRYENTKLRLADQALRQATVARLGTRFLALDSVEEILATAVGGLREALRVDFCEVFELCDQSSLVLRAGDGWPGDRIGRHRFDTTADCEAGLALRSADPLIVVDQTTEARFHVGSLPSELGARCGVTVRIPGRVAPLGVLGVHARGMREFTPEDIYFQQSVATLVGSAMVRRMVVAEREALIQRTTAAREAAETASEAKTRFLGIMSHELRTPLNAIGGYVELLQAGTRGAITDDQRLDLTRIARNQRYLVSLIDNALSYLKLENGKVRYEIGDVQVSGLVAALDDVIRPLIDAKALSYVRHLPPEDLHVSADRGKLQQIMINLLSNAVKFTETGGTLTLECSVGDETVRIHVRDSGMGIPADRLHGLFEPFAQVRENDGLHGSGTGLGLSISREFALGMGGNLVACSEPGRGSVFTLVLPRREPEPRGATTSNDRRTTVERPSN
jgi:signal transduction histidine kinase